MDICVSGIRRITGQITGQITGYSGQTLLSVIVARSDWFLYCVIICIVESIPVDCNFYFELLNKFVKLNFLSFPVAT